MPRFTQLVLKALPVALLAVQPASCQILEYFYGGTFAITRDSSGAFFTGGRIQPGAFPVTPGTYQTNPAVAFCGTDPRTGSPTPCNTGFVAKYTQTGEIVWATYLGAPVAEGDEVADVAVDPDGNVWVEGIATSQNFPVTSNAYLKTYPGGTPSSFLAELSPDGSKLLYSSFEDTTFSIGSLSLAQRDALYFIGNGVLKFNPATNQTVYRALQGEISTPLDPFFANTIPLVDESGALYLATSTNQADFPITPGVYSHPSTGYDVVLIGLDPVGNLIFSTVIGGSGDEGVTAMGRDTAGNFYLSGYSNSPDFPLTGGQSLGPPGNNGSPFVMELSPSASTLILSSPSFSAGVSGAVKFDSNGKLSMILAGGPGGAVKLTPDSYQPCYPAGMAGGVSPSDASTFVRLTADFQGIEYATAIPFPSANIYIGPFDFDTSGNVYIISGPSLNFEALDVAHALHSGPLCIGATLTQTSTPAVPGLLLSIYGPGIGPAQPASLTLDASGRVATRLAGIEVLIDGIPAPILSASSAQVDVVVPFGVGTSGNTTVSVSGPYPGTLTNALAPQSIWFYSTDGTGYGTIAWDQTGKPNSATNPAHVGDYLTFFATGAGAMTPTPVDGTIPQSPQSAASNFTFPASGGPTCPITYAGDVPGLVEGIVQINCQLSGPLPSYPNFPNMVLIYGNVVHPLYVQ